MKRDAQSADRLAKPEGSSDNAVERRQRKRSGFAAGKEVPLECRGAYSRLPAQPGAGKRDTLYYFHGFNSAIPEDISSSPKISAVANFCQATGRVFLPQNIDYRYADRHSQELLDSIPEDVESILFCGASMGGWFARIMQLLLAGRRPGLDIEAVAFNPAFNLAEFSHHLEGHQVNYVTGAEHVFTADHGAMLVAMERSVEYGADLPFWVYVDRDDEVINAQWSEHWHSGYARFLAFPGGCHSFDHTRQALEDFQPGCWKGTGQ